MFACSFAAGLKFSTCMTYIRQNLHSNAFQRRAGPYITDPSAQHQTNRLQPSLWISYNLSLGHVFRIPTKNKTPILHITQVQERRTIHSLNLSKLFASITLRFTHISLPLFREKTHRITFSHQIMTHPAGRRLSRQFDWAGSLCSSHPVLVWCLSLWTTSFKAKV